MREHKKEHMQISVKAVKTGRPEKYGVGKLEVGEFKFLPDQDSQSSACVSARALGRRSGKVFSCETVNGGVRIWRIA